MSTSSQANSITEDLGYGVCREWLHNRRILIMTVKIEGESVRETMDTWAAGVIESIQAWPKGQTMLLMHDATHATFSAYLRRKIDEVDRATPTDIHGRTAVVVTRTAVGRFLSLSAQTTARFFRKRIELKVFFDRESALSWLEEGL